MYRTLGLFLLLFVGFTLPRCGSGYDCGNVDSPSYFDIQGLRLNNVDLSGQLANARNLLPNTALPLDDYALHLRFNVEYVTQWSPVFSLQSSAWACSPLPPGYDGAKTETWADIDIITLDTFGLDYPPETSIRDFFQIEEEAIYDHRFSVPFNTSITDFLQARTGEGVMREVYTLKLTRAPENDASLKFAVEVTFEDGEMYRLENQVMQVY